MADRWCVCDSETMKIVGGPYDWDGLDGPDHVPFEGLPELGPFPESSNGWHTFPTHLTMLEADALSAGYVYPPDPNAPPAQEPSTDPVSEG